MPWEPTDLALVGDRYYCRCGDWGDPVVTPVARRRNVHAVGITGGYYDTVEEAVHCKRDKALCAEHPYRRINMIGVAARVGNKRWVVLCATCGVLMQWQHDCYSERGPDCGHHREDAVNALRYQGARAYIHHGYEMSTPERPYRFDRGLLAELRTKRRMHETDPAQHPALTPREEYILKQHRVLSSAFRDRLAIARRDHYATDRIGRSLSSHHCIYCMRRIPPGGGASILVVKNGLDEAEERRRYEERCDVYGRVINRASANTIYGQTGRALGTDASAATATPAEGRAARMGETTTLELVRLCAVDWRNVRTRMFYDSTTVPFLEDLFRWIDARRHKKTLNSAHWGKRRMIHKHYYRHETRRAARAPPTRMASLS